MSKRYRSIDVLTAARARIRKTFDEFECVYVSFSAGKDSGVMLHLALEEARKRGRLPLDVLFIDLEAQYQHTIDFATRMLSIQDIRAHWVCLPLRLRNAVSQFQSHWTCWDDGKREAWVRDLPEMAIHNVDHFPSFTPGMEFEEFILLFGKWLAGGRRTACMVGIRTDESLNRYRTIVRRNKNTYKGYRYTTRMDVNLYNVYPIYDWRTEDIWTANGRFGYDYNKIYDLMFMAGVGIHQMRICQPYGDDQRKGLYLFKMLEPETWAKVVNRVAGANTGNRYSRNDRHTLGNYKVVLPPKHTYESYARFLLETMPPHLREHYSGRIIKFITWWEQKGFDRYGLPREIPDFTDSRLEAARKAPSWRRIVKVLLKNDYWCKGLSFSVTKHEMDEQLKIIMRYTNL